MTSSPILTDAARTRDQTELFRSSTTKGCREEKANYRKRCRKSPENVSNPFFLLLLLLSLFILFYSLIRFLTDATFRSFREKGTKPDRDFPSRKKPKIFFSSSFLSELIFRILFLVQFTVLRTNYSLATIAKNVDSIAKLSLLYKPILS